MPRFEPFPGVRYDLGGVDVSAVVAPPYDVVGPADRADLAARSPYNAVHVDVVDDAAIAARTGDAQGGCTALSVPGSERPTGYDTAGCRFEEWLAAHVLAVDPEPSFYVYRMGYRDDDGRPRQTTGVVGALELSVPGEGTGRDAVLPHERTLPKAKDDRLRLMRACRANLSPVWCLTLAQGLSALCEPSGTPTAICTDDDGVHHRLWRITQPAVTRAISDLVASAPVVIADGHHRYETALAYRDERRAANGDHPADYDLLMALVVELAPDELGVRAIHRLLTGLPDGFDLPGALSGQFDPAPIRSGDARTGPESGGPMLVTAEGSWVLTTRPAESAGAAGAPGEPGKSGEPGDDDPPDSEMLDAALASLPPHTLGFDHRAAYVEAEVAAGRAQAGFLLRPVAVGQIAAAARAGRRMPEKTTFFSPKPRTGMVFRRVTG
ncbi:MAG: DUF1015 family protein [Acidimicrobiales bacterium]